MNQIKCAIDVFIYLLNFEQVSRNLSEITET